MEVSCVRVHEPWWLLAHEVFEVWWSTIKSAQIAIGMQDIVDPTTYCRRYEYSELISAWLELSPVRCTHRNVISYLGGLQDSGRRLRQTERLLAWQPYIRVDGDCGVDRFQENLRLPDAEMRCLRYGFQPLRRYKVARRPDQRKCKGFGVLPGQENNKKFIRWRSAKGDISALDAWWFVFGQSILMNNCWPVSVNYT